MLYTNQITKVQKIFFCRSRPKVSLPLRGFWGFGENLFFLPGHRNFLLFVFSYRIIKKAPRRKYVKIFFRLFRVRQHLRPTQKKPSILYRSLMSIIWKPISKLVSGIILRNFGQAESEIHIFAFFPVKNGPILYIWPNPLIQAHIS